MVAELGEVAVQADSTKMIPTKTLAWTGKAENLMQRVITTRL
tara:strand:- start:337 stop:462 length:126 start_codon:yes stop_codon:yes gene_type:complete